MSSEKNELLENNINKSNDATLNTNTYTKIPEEIKNILSKILNQHLEKRLSKLEHNSKEGQHNLKTTGLKFKEFINNIYTLQKGVKDTLKELEKSKKKMETKKIKVNQKERISKSHVPYKKLKINVNNDCLTNKTEIHKDKIKTNININNYKTEDIKKINNRSKTYKNKEQYKIKEKQLKLDKIDNYTSPSKPEDNKAKTIQNYATERKPEQKKIYNSTIINKSRSTKKYKPYSKSQIFSDVASERSIKNLPIKKNEKTELKTITHIKDKTDKKIENKKKPLIKKNKDKDKDKNKKIMNKKDKKEEKIEDKKEQKEEIKKVEDIKRDGEIKNEKVNKDDNDVNKEIKIDEKKNEINMKEKNDIIVKEENKEDNKNNDDITNTDKQKDEIKPKESETQKIKEEKIEQNIEEIKKEEKIDKTKNQEEKKIDNEIKQENVPKEDSDKKDEKIEEIQNQIIKKPEDNNQLSINNENEIIKEEIKIEKQTEQQPSSPKENQIEIKTKKEPLNKEIITSDKKEEPKSPIDNPPEIIIVKNEDNKKIITEQKPNLLLNEGAKNDIINQEKKNEIENKEEKVINNETIKQNTGNENNDLLIENFKKESEMDKLADDELIKHYQSQYIDLELNQSLNQNLSFSQSFLQSKSMLGEKPPKTAPRDPNIPLTLDEIIKKYKNDFIYVFDFLTFKEKIQFSGIHKGFKSERIYLLNTKREEAITSLELKERETLEDRITQFKLKFPKKEYMKPLEAYKINKASIMSIQNLDKDMYSKLFKQKVLDIKLSDIYILYRILFVILGEPKIAEIEEDEVFWLKCIEYLNEKGKDKIGSFILEKMKQYEFKHKDIYLLNKLLVGIKPKMNPATFSKISGTSGLLFIGIKEMLEYSGILITKKTPINRIYDNLMYYKTIIDPLTNFIDFLSNIKST